MTTANQLLLLLTTVLLLSFSAFGGQIIYPPQYDCSEVIYSDNCKPVTCYTDCLKKYTKGEGLCVTKGCKCNFYFKSASFPNHNPTDEN